MTHDDLCEAVVTLADSMNLRAVYNPDSRRIKGGRGFPDVTVAGPRGVLFAEVKTGLGELSSEQRHWFWMLRASGQLVTVIRPLEWDTGQVVGMLRAMCLRPGPDCQCDDGRICRYCAGLPRDIRL